jgi:hypothetical protein
MIDITVNKEMTHQSSSLPEILSKRQFKNKYFVTILKLNVKKTSVLHE